ncbi:hypothetical protein JCGZ_22983 [Jatropha curcas]|uniref:Uncharacterized protein n=1 Tax=Jatropha curcas TaxID=180498 RepID=A0A067JPV3_JATCU|nr:protein CLAVATA 3 [Jatropha curcas]KDP25912.1 hypothetical protein JCGZ_22983 [Jatropha curcas]
MASKIKFYSVMLLLMVVMEQASGCRDQKCFYPKARSLDYEIQGRKMLPVSSKEPTTTVNGKKLVVRELRTVPSGPDPLHHNGGTPKKPTTP